MPKHKLQQTYTHPLIEHKLTLMRDRLCSTEKFRRLMKEIGVFLAFEVSRHYALKPCKIDIPAAQPDQPTRSMEGQVLSGEQTAIVALLRSGLTLAEGMLEVMPAARLGHMGLNRGEIDRKEHKYEPIEYLVSLPDPRDRNFILADPVVGTGILASRAIEIVKALRVDGSKIQFATVLIAPRGLDLLQKNHPDVQVFPICIEAALDDDSYVFPGFGNVTNRLFGTPLEQT